MKEYLLKRPMFISGLICTVISVTSYFYMPSLLIFGALLIFAIGFAVFKGVKPEIVFSLFMAVVMIISCVFTYGKIERLTKFSGESYPLKLTVCKETYEGENYSRVTAQVIEGDLPKGTKINFSYKGNNLKVGEVVKAYIKVTKVEEKYRPNEYSQDVFLNGKAEDTPILTNEKDIILSFAQRTREYITKSLFKNMENDEAATLCALIFGERKFLRDEFYENVKAAGVSHVLVVSGMHLAIIMSIFIRLFEKGVYNRFLRAVLIILIVLFLNLICGFTMSMQRAGITYFMIAISYCLNRKSNPDNTIGTAMTVILISSPFAILSVALQLSMLSTYGILSIALPINRVIKQRKLIKTKAVSILTESAIITLSATLLTFPVSVYVFGYVSAVALLPNLIISLIITQTFMLSILALLINLIAPCFATVFFISLGVIVKFINCVINFFGGLDWAVAEMPDFAGILCMGLIILVFWCLLTCKKYVSMLKLVEKDNKIVKEGGKRLKWR